MNDRSKPHSLPRILARRDTGPSRLMRVEEVDLQFSNGVQRTFERIRARGLGAVMIVPLLDRNTVLLVREYAAGLHRYEIGLPKGRLEAGETPEQGANREMQEEIGYAAKRFISLGYLTLAPGYMAHRTELIVACDLYPKRLPGDEPEPLETVRWPMDQLSELVRRKDCSEGRSIAALFMTREILGTIFEHAKQ